MADDEEIRDKLPSGWKGKIKSLYTTVERYLGPVVQGEPRTRQELRHKLFELSLMIYSVRNLEYWNTRLANLLQEVGEMIEVELEWAPWCSREFKDCAKDLRRYGTSQVNLVP
jgi:hypothetical protein